MASTTAHPPSRPARGKGPDGEQTVVEPYRLTPKLARRVAVLSGLVVIGFAALVLRLWALQVLSGSQYVARVTANQLRTVPVEAPRGSIVDRGGDVLVTNRLVTAIQLWPASLPRLYSRRVDELQALSRVTGVSLHEITALILQRRHASDLLDPVIVQSQVPAGMAAYLEERSGEFPGVTLGRSYVRTYPHGSLAAQLLG